MVWSQRNPADLSTVREALLVACSRGGSVQQRAVTGQTNLVTPRAFGEVQGVVNAYEQAFLAFSRLKFAQAETDGNMAYGIDAVRFNAGADALGYDVQAVQRRCTAQDHEFLAAPACHISWLRNCGRTSSTTRFSTRPPASWPKVSLTRLK